MEHKKFRELVGYKIVPLNSEVSCQAPKTLAKTVRFVFTTIFTTRRLALTGSVTASVIKKR